MSNPSVRDTLDHLFYQFRQVLLFFVWPAIAACFVVAMFVAVTACYWITAIIIVEAANLVEYFITPV